MLTAVNEKTILKRIGRRLIETSALVRDDDTSSMLMNPKTLHGRAFAHNITGHAGDEPQRQTEKMRSRRVLTSGFVLKRQRPCALVLVTLFGAWHTPIYGLGLALPSVDDGLPRPFGEQ